MTILVKEIRVSKPVTLTDDGPIPSPRRVRVVKALIRHNGAPQVHGVAHLVEIDGNPNTKDDAPLKWANFPGAERPLPTDFETCLGLLEFDDTWVYLHSVSDTYPKPWLAPAEGSHTFTFRLDCEDHSITFTVGISFGETTTTLGT